MGKETRVGGPTRRGDLNHARGTPYDRPSGSTQNPADVREKDLVRLGESSQPAHRQQSMQENDAERRTSWSSWMYTPLKALKESYMYLSKSPVKTDEVDENVGGHHLHQTASSTAADVIEEGESQKPADQLSSREDPAGPSRPPDMTLPGRALGNMFTLPSRLGAATPARPSGASEGAGSSYDDIRARNVTLLSNSPLAAGSPWQPRLRPGSGSVQPSPAQSSGALGTPTGQPAPSLSNRPFQSVGPSRFGLRDGPAPSPLALTPAQPFRATAPRGSRPFARTPIHMQPLSAAVPAVSVPTSATAAPEPAPLSWTPMRTYSSMQPRAGAALSLKRGRAEGSPLGTPLLGAGLAAESDRRIRRRGEQGERSAERRVWKAGQTPTNPKPAAGREVLAIEGPSASGASQMANGLAGKREPLPMTESARRIAMALDAMIPTSSPEGMADVAAVSAPERKPAAPPSDSLGVAPAPLLSSFTTMPATSSSAQPSRLDAFQKPAFSWASQPQPAPSAAQTTANPGLWPAVIPAAPPAASWSSWTPSLSLPKDNDLPAPQMSPSSPTPNATAALPLTPVGPSFPKPSLFNFSNAQKVENPIDGPAATEDAEVVTAKFSFRPARSLLDSAEKLKPPVQPQLAAPTPEKVLAENNRAAAAASQPLPVSDDEEEEGQEDEDGSDEADIKGVTRSSPRADENGNLSAATGAATAAAPATTAGGWDLTFLKKNQEQAAAATKAAEKAIEAEKGGAESNRQESSAKGGWDASFLKQNQAQAAAATEAAEKAIAAEKGGDAVPKAQPSTARTGWDLDFLNSNKAAVGAATAAAEAELDKEAGKSSSGLLSFLGTVVPNSSSTAFAPSTSSGFTFGLKQPAEASEPAATCAITAVAPASSAVLSFLTASTPTPHNATENGDASASKADGPVWALPKKDKAAEAPPATSGFSFGGTALPFSFPAASSSSAAATSTTTALPFPQPQPFSLGAASEPAAAAQMADATTSAAASEARAAVSAPALPASLTFGTALSTGLFGFGTTAPPASSAAASTPFSFGASSAPAEAEAPAKAPISFQLKPAAAPFAPSSAFTFGTSATAADVEDSQKPSQPAPTGLSLTQAEGSGRSLDSNMSVSPSAGAGAANPFVTLETGPASEAPSTTGFPSFMAPASSAAARAPFTFGVAPAASATASLGLPAPAGGGMGFKSGSLTSFGAASTSAFGVGAASAPSQSSMFGANANSGFGAPASAPAFGGSAVTSPAFGATQSGSLAFGASAIPTFGPSGTPTFGAGSAQAFGASSTPAFGQMSARAFGAGSAPAFGAGAFGGPASTPAFGGFGGGAGPFGAQPQSPPAAAAPFGASHTTPAWGAQPASAPTFGQAPAQPSANAAPGPFGGPLQPAFGMQQQQPAPANPFAFQGTPSGALGGDTASGFTMGMGDSQQQQGQLARRIKKVKRKGR